MNSRSIFVQLCIKYLTSILASLQISCTHHTLSDHAGVGVLTFLVGQYGHFHTLEVKWVEHCNLREDEINIFYLFIYFIERKISVTSLIRKCKTIYAPWVTPHFVVLYPQIKCIVLKFNVMKHQKSERKCWTFNAVETKFYGLSIIQLWEKLIDSKHTTSLVKDGSGRNNRAPLHCSWCVQQRRMGIFPRRLNINMCHIFKYKF